MEKVKINDYYKLDNIIIREKLTNYLKKEILVQFSLKVSIFTLLFITVVNMIMPSELTTKLGLTIFYTIVMLIILFRTKSYFTSYIKEVLIEEEVEDIECLIQAEKLIENETAKIRNFIYIMGGSASLIIISILIHIK